MIAEVLQLLQSLAAEHIALHVWRKNAENHFRDGDMLDIGDRAGSQQHALTQYPFF